MRGFSKRFLCFTIALVLAVLPGANSFALSATQLDIFSQNNILFYDPEEDNMGGETCFGTLSGSTLYEKVLSYLLSIGLNAVGASGVYGNMMHEGLGSGVLLEHENGVDEQKDIGTWYRAATYYGPNGLFVQEKDVRDLDNPEIMHGLGFIQWSFDRRVALLNALAAAGGLDKYAREWDDAAGRYVYDSMNYDQLSGAIGQDTADAILITELEFFNSEHQSYTVQQSDIDAQGIAKYGVTAGMNIFDALNLLESPEEAAELFFTTSELPGATRFNSTGTARKNHARNGYDLIMSAGITPGGATSCGGGNGDIVATAILLAWPDHRVHAKDDPKPEYVTAMQQVGTYVDPCNRSGCAPKGASCDIFVSTVVRYSGVDPDFPIVGPGAQLNHMVAHPEIYEEIENLGNTSNLQAGDIFVASYNNAHILIYMGVVDGKWMQASASFNGRTGEYYSYEEYSHSSGGPYRIFRARSSKVDINV